MKQRNLKKQTITNREVAQMDSITQTIEEATQQLVAVSNTLFTVFVKISAEYKRFTASHRAFADISQGSSSSLHTARLSAEEFFEPLSPSS